MKVNLSKKERDNLIALLETQILQLENELNKIGIELINYDYFKNQTTIIKNQINITNTVIKKFKNES